jgi:hypothetical protein
MKNIFRFDDKERRDMKAEIEKEIASGEVDPDKHEDES